MEKNYYPVFLQLKNKQCVVVGGGDVAARKVAALLACDAVVRVISPEIVPELQTLADTNRIEAICRPYTRESLADAFIVIAATNNHQVNQLVAEHCHEDGIPVNVADAPHLCDFIVPATIRRGPLTIAVSTGGTLPAMAKKIRRQLENDFDEAYGELLTALGQARTQVLDQIPDSARRKRIFTALAAEDLLSTIHQGGRAALDRRIAEIIQHTK
ncbi:precorrin-2 dehydrogenase/sirohydrochlorin ferrochelatase family protein [Dethiobacter alkaliphilus]|uniref:precorrin-2 dehydrogenase n=1 Tax=Dethiobacter alkaliphilus AHT 1 TaxID=555088 RepID=C0GG57_DETAL|nr:bifunctional precorrin-2 dehydrogenase/sirohydrochlorin ferrochelatase [Dethiobacter alkaliphilus]EEG77746.1 siroheme synthase [Dethiobacter alkaliphilus AHT 1]